jgi:L-alanine-DL-glutamate epimerase-like enolase superfamily enzyme
VKITDVRTTVLVTHSIIVQVFTDEGIVGLGECSPMHATIVSTFVDEVL